MTNRTRIKLFILVSLIFLPRLWPFPAGFLAVDELFTARWLTQMATGVLTQNWAATANDTYPAVSLMWLEVAQVTVWHGTTGASYDQLLADDEAVVFASIPRRRFALGFINGLILLAAFAWLRALYTETIAFIAVGLMALDPFMLTQAQVVRTEGLNYGLMLLSALAMFRYIAQPQRHWLIGSAIIGGLAILTRFISIYLWPFAVLLLLWARARGEIRAWSQVFTASLVWLIIATLTFIILWPALWVAPVATLTALYDHLARTAQGVGIVWHDGEFFYQGQLWRSDPGVMFYVWAWAYRTTPFMWLGLSLLPFALRRNILAPHTCLAWLAYIFCYLLAMSLGESKLDRYLLPTFPAFALLAAMGYAGANEALALRLQRVRALPAALGLLASMMFTAYYSPYYFTYWNPLLGGATAAVKILPVGTGEGVDQMVSYANTLPQASQLKLASNHQTCRFAFVGTCLSSSDFLASDYFLTFVAGVQRQQPLADLTRLIPDAEIVQRYHHDGLDYAWLYRLPPDLQAVGQWVGEHGRLSGFRLQPATAVHADQTLQFTLFWQNGAKGWQMDDSGFFLSVYDDQQRHILTTHLPLQPSSQPYLNRSEQILAFTAPLTLPTLPLGDYHFELTLRLLRTREATWRFDLTEIPHTFRVTQGAPSAAWTENSPLTHHLLQWKGYEMKPASQWVVYWQSAAAPPTEPYRLRVTWHDPASGQTVTDWENTLLPPDHTWQAHELVAVNLPLLLAWPRPVGQYQPTLTLLIADTPITTLTLPSAGVTWLTPTLGHQHALDEVSFGQQLDLFGYDLQAHRTQSGGQLTVTLYWLNRYPLTSREVQLRLFDEGQQELTTLTSPLSPPEAWPLGVQTSQHTFALTALPAQLHLQTRPVGQTAWDRVYQAQRPLTETLVIDQLLTKMGLN